MVNGNLWSMGTGSVGVSTLPFPNPTRLPPIFPPKSNGRCQLCGTESRKFNFETRSHTQLAMSKGHSSNRSKLEEGEAGRIKEDLHLGKSTTVWTA